MTATMRRLAVAALVGCFLVVWRLDTSRDVVSAQAPKPIVVTRLYTGPDGQTHAEDITVKVKPGDGSGERSEMMKVTGLQFRRTSPSYALDWHTAPRRQYVITLSGRGEIELAGGKKIPMGPGHILLAEDVTGKGHISRAVGKEDRLSLIIPLAEQP
jgi:quercetin dioxygenase-like cupin family protein